MRIAWRAFLSLSVLALTGCGVRQQLAVGSMVPILENAAGAARERSDLDMIGQAFPANLLLLDGLIRTDPDNEQLLGLGSYLYFGYSLGFVESSDALQASNYYALGRDYGMRALDRRDAFRKGREGNLEAFGRGVKALKEEDVPALAWTAANWGRWLSLNLDSPAAIADMPKLEALLDRLLELDPAYEHGLPEALRGIYDATRPAMFGGNAERARGHFERAFQVSKRQMLLYQVFYAEFYCRQVLDEECFKTALDEVLQAPAGELPDANLMNEIARRRARDLLARQPELF